MKEASSKEAYSPEFINEFAEQIKNKEKLYKNLLEKENNQEQKEKIKKLLTLVAGQKDFINFMLEALQNADNTMM